MENLYPCYSTVSQSSVVIPTQFPFHGVLEPYTDNFIRVFRVFKSSKYNITPNPTPSTSYILYRNISAYIYRRKISIFDVEFDQSK